MPVRVVARDRNEVEGEFARWDPFPQIPPDLRTKVNTSLASGIVTRRRRCQQTIRQLGGTPGILANRNSCCESESKVRI